MRRAIGEDHDERDGMKRFFRSATLFGVIDHPTEGQSVDRSVQVDGWVMTRINQHIELVIMVDGQPVEIDVRRSPREDVRKVHARYARHNPTPGYIAQLPLDSLTPGRHTIAVRASGRREQKLLGQIEVAVPTEIEREGGKDELYWRTTGLATHRKRLLCIHIPKTGGTSLNAYLSEHYESEHSYLHAENGLIGKARYEVGDLDRFELISGHVQLDLFDQFLVRSRYFSVTLLREPVQHLISHLAWVKRLARPDRVLERLRAPDHIKRAVERIDRLDLIEFIDTMTPEEENLFDNCQIRYFLPRGTGKVDETHLPDALARMAEIDLVGTTDRLYDFLLLLAFEMGWPSPQGAPRLNTGSQNDWIDLDTAEDSLLARFRRLTRLDEVVYRQAQRMFETRLRGVVKILGQHGASPDPFTGLTPSALANAMAAFQTSLEKTGIPRGP